MGLRRCSGTSLLWQTRLIILGSTETLYHYSWYRILVTTSTSNTRVNRNLGHHEANGVLGAIRYLGSQVPEIDRTRWGEVELLLTKCCQLLEWPNQDRTSWLELWSISHPCGNDISKGCFFYRLVVHEDMRSIKLHIGLVGRSTMYWNQGQRIKVFVFSSGTLYLVWCCWSPCHWLAPLRHHLHWEIHGKVTIRKLS